MKNIQAIFSVAALAFASALAQSAPQPPAAATEPAAKSLDEEFKQFHTECQELAAKNFKASFGAYWENDIREAISRWEKAIAEPKWTNRQKIDMLIAVAGYQLNTWYDEKLSSETIARIDQLPGLSSNDMQYASIKLADFRYAAGIAGEAEAEYFLSVVHNDKANPSERNKALKKAVEIIGANDKAKGWALLADKKYDSIHRITALRNSLAGKYLSREELAKYTAADRAAYREALASWKGTNFVIPDFIEKMIRPWAEEGLDAIQREFPPVASSIVARAAATKHGGHIAKARPGEALYQWASTPPRNNMKCLQRNGALRKFVYEVLQNKAYGKHRITDIAMLNFLSDQEETKEIALVYATKILEEAGKEGAKSDPKAVDAAFVFTALYNTKGDGAKIVDGIRKIAEYRGKKDDKQTIAELISGEANKAMAEGDEECARYLLAEYQKVVPGRGQSRLDCEYWPDAPEDIGLILASERYARAEKGLLRHPYGKNLAILLLTDVALEGREIKEGDAGEFRPSELFSFFDNNGVKIILRSYENMEKIKAGFANASGYETYLAPGVEAPYWCYLFSPKEGGLVEMSDQFITQYPNLTGYRTAVTKDKTMAASSLFLADGAAVMISIPWTTAFMYTPDRESAWYFEPINWVRGGRSWGGSPSVHHRSNFGRLEFKGADKKAITAIRRKLLPYAKKVFEAACNPRDNSPFDRWQDNVLGDQEFYLAKVKPFRDKLASYLNGNRVRFDMTDDEVNEIFEAAALDAFNCRFIISKMRTDWLDEKRICEE